MSKEKKVLYQVECAFNHEHQFPKTFTIEDGSENKITKVEAFCPYCGKQVTVSVKGKVVPDTDILRGEF